MPRHRTDGYHQGAWVQFSKDAGLNDRGIWPPGLSYNVAYLITHVDGEWVYLDGIMSPYGPQGQLGINPSLLFLCKEKPVEEKIDPIFSLEYEEAMKGEEVFGRLK